MNDTIVHVTKLVTISAWAASVLLLILAWVLVLAGDAETRRLGFIIGITSMIVSVWAGTLQVRCWSIRVCNLVRVTSNLESEPVPVRSLR